MAERQVTRDQQLIGANELAKRLNISLRRIYQLADEGIVQRADRGKYYLWASVTGYIRFLQESSYSRAVSVVATVPAEAQGGSEDAKADYDAEKARLTRAKRISAELDLAVKSGQLHRAAEVEGVMTDMLATFRTRVLALPARVAPLVLGKEELAEVKSTMQKYVKEVLEELSDYEPKKFAPKGAQSVLDEDDE